MVRSKNNSDKNDSTSAASCLQILIRNIIFIPRYRRSISICSPDHSECCEYSFFKTSHTQNHKSLDPMSS